MQVLINGEPKEISNSLTVAELLSELKLEGKLAIEINQNIIPRSLHQETKLKAKDQIEIVNAIVGG